MSKISPLERFREYPFNYLTVKRKFPRKKSHNPTFDPATRSISQFKVLGSNRHLGRFRQSAIARLSSHSRREIQIARRNRRHYVGARVGRRPDGGGTSGSLAAWPLYNIGRAAGVVRFYGSRERQVAIYGAEDRGPWGRGRLVRLFGNFHWFPAKRDHRCSRFLTTPATRVIPWRELSTVSCPRSGPGSRSIYGPP